MCSLFWQIMENDRGDLADIVRVGGGVPITDWRSPSDDMMSYLPSLSVDHRHAEDFGDPFASLQDPLLHELAGATFFDGPDSSAGLAKMSMAEGHCSGGSSLLAQNLLGEEMMKRPCSIFSRVLQISPGAAKPSPMVGDMVKVNNGSPACPVDHGGVQISPPQTLGIKRRKSQAKKVVCIPAPAAAASNRSSGEVVPSDLWAWRKYGQKPIKGSPYPRGYYRCSSSKGCPARKQVERSRTDPNMLVITYTCEHNHPWPTQRNALAGSTRSQPASKNNSSSSSKTSSPRNQRSPTSLKEEAKETLASTSVVPSVVKEEEVGRLEMEMDAADDREFDQLVLHQSFKSMLSESNHSDDFFADLGELDPADPMNLMFSRGFLGDKSIDDGRENKALDPINIFGWAGNSVGEAKRGL